MLDDLLELEGARRVRDVQHLSLEQHVAVPELKLSIVDVKCALSEGPFRAALDVARRAAFTPIEWEAYERSKMAEQDARGMLTVAREEGATAAKAAAILAVLAARGLSISAETRWRIESCKEAITLDRWIARAATAASAEDAIAEPAEPE